MLYGLSVMAAERGTGRVQRFPVAGHQPHQGAVSQRRQEDTPPPPRKTALRASGEDVPRPKRPKTGKAGRTEAISWRSRRPAQWIGRGAEMTEQSTIKCSACKAGAGEEETDLRPDVRAARGFDFSHFPMPRLHVVDS